MRLPSKVTEVRDRPSGRGAVDDGPSLKAYAGPLQALHCGTDVGDLKRDVARPTS